MSISFIMIFFLLVFSTMLFQFPIEKIDGHANPIAYLPLPNSTIDKSVDNPFNVTILFSEKPEPKLGHIRVTNSNNERIDNNDYAVIGGNNNGAMVTLDEDRLSNGIYFVSWLTVSQGSGLITKGSYNFTVK